MEPDSVDEISHIFFDFSSQKFIKTASSKLVDEGLDLFFSLWQSESEMNININIGIILCWASLNWGIIVDNISGKHARNSFPAWIAPLCTSRHDSGGCAAILFEYGVVCWNIKLQLAAAASIASFDHHNNTLPVGVGSACHFVSSLGQVVRSHLENS